MENHFHLARHRGQRHHRAAECDQREDALGASFWFPKHKITLGLDLQGGSHVMLQVDRNDIVKERLQSTIDDVRSKLREANIGYTGLTGTGQTVQVRVRDLSQVDAAKKALAPLTQPVSAGTLTSGSIVEATLSDAGDGLLKLNITDQGIEYRMASAVTQSTEVIRRRVDELGTTEPTIQREGSDRIIVQVPGLQDPQRLKNILNRRRSCRSTWSTRPCRRRMR